MAEYKVGKVLNEGKTKIIREIEGGKLVEIESKDDTTAGDGARHDVITGKAALSTETTSLVFQMLKDCGAYVAFSEQVGPTKFVADRCEMIPYEVVVRRDAMGSFLERHPYIARGHVFPQLMLEFFLKTKDKKWLDHALPADDPLCAFRDGQLHLYHPHQPLHGQEPFLVLDDFPLKGEIRNLEAIGNHAKFVFLVLEKCFQQVGAQLNDFKVEFGYAERGGILLADVIDADSWRTDYKGQQISKQVYREGATPEEFRSKAEIALQLVRQFRLPRQRVVLWQGSKDDDPKPFLDEFIRIADNMSVQKDCEWRRVVCSMHKEPARGYQILATLEHEVPGTVIIADIGMSNGAGPTLSANTTLPVITTVQKFKDFPEDVWSSLRTPRATPVSTVLSPKNAVLHALQILAMQNPRLYAILRLEQEKRLRNFVELDNLDFHVE